MDLVLKSSFQRDVGLISVDVDEGEGSGFDVN